MVTLTESIHTFSVPIVNWDTMCIS